MRPARPHRKNAAYRAAFCIWVLSAQKNVKYCDNNIGRSGNHCRAAIVATSSIFLRASAGGCRSGVVVARDRLVDR
jgi:hypothetical protein